MICIVMTYLSRQAQLNNTLESFRQYDPKEFVVVVVDDGSPQDIILPNLPFKVDVIKVSNKTWHNTCVPFNMGCKAALAYDPEVIILQNAECQHEGDILSEAIKVKDDNYISFACYSLAHGETPVVEKQNKAASFNDESSWYNHSVYRPVGFHFCCAITADNLRKLNGFDERLADGVAYEDNMFLHQIACLGLRIDFVDYPMVYHQWHDRPYVITEELVRRNFITFTELQKEINFRALHTITPDL